MAGLPRTFDQIQNPIIWLIHCRQPDLVQSVTIAFGLRYLGLAFFFFPPLSFSLSLFFMYFTYCLAFGRLVFYLGFVQDRRVECLICLLD